MNSFKQTRSPRLCTLFLCLAALFALIGGLVSVLESNNTVLAVVNGSIVDSSDPYPFSSLGLMHATTTIGDAYGSRRVDNWCGATLIASQWAVTAEHCLYYSGSAGLLELFHYSGLYQAKDITVTFGSTFSNGSGGTTRTVSKILPERSINLQDPSNKNKSEAQLFDKNDLTLLELSSPIDGPLTVGGIAPLSVGGYCRDWTVGSQVLTAGWGQGSADSNSPPINTMQEASLKFEGIADNIETQAPEEY